MPAEDAPTGTFGVVKSLAEVQLDKYTIYSVSRPPAGATISTDRVSSCAVLKSSLQRDTRTQKNALVPLELDAATQYELERNNCIEQVPPFTNDVIFKFIKIHDYLPSELLGAMRVMSCFELTAGDKANLTILQRSDNNLVLFCLYPKGRGYFGLTFRRMTADTDKLVWSRNLPVVSSTLEFLRVLHDNRYVHGDVKPANIMYMDDDPGKSVSLSFAVGDYGSVKPGVKINSRDGTSFFASPFHSNSEAREAWASVGCEAHFDTLRSQQTTMRHAWWLWDIHALGASVAVQRAEQDGLITPTPGTDILCQMASALFQNFSERTIDKLEIVNALMLMKDQPLQPLQPQPRSRVARPYEPALPYERFFNPLFEDQRPDHVLRPIYAPINGGRFLLRTPEGSVSSAATTALLKGRVQKLLNGLQLFVSSLSPTRGGADSKLSRTDSNLSALSEGTDTDPQPNFNEGDDGVGYWDDPVAALHNDDDASEAWLLHNESYAQQLELALTFYVLPNLMTEQQQLRFHDCFATYLALRLDAMLAFTQSDIEDLQSCNGAMEAIHKLLLLETPAQGGGASRRNAAKPVSKAKAKTVKKPTKTAKKPAKRSDAATKPAMKLAKKRT
jgi:serine/threonine protein kinase